MIPVTKKYLALTGILALSITLVGCDETEKEPLTVPDVVGLPGDEARDLIEEFDLETSLESAESSVWQPANWEVESTDPEAGTEVEEEDEVIVNLVRPAEDEEAVVTEDDDEETEDEASSESEATAENDEDEDADEPEELPEERFDFREETWDGETTVWVEFDIDDHFTRGLAASAAEGHTLDGIEIASQEYPNYDRISVNAYGETVDNLGNEDRSILVVAVYERDTVERINFENRAMIDIWDARDAGGGCMPALCD